MDGNSERTIFYVKTWNHPTETIIKNWLFLEFRGHIFAFALSVSKRPTVKQGVVLIFECYFGTWIRPKFIRFQKTSKGPSQSSLVTGFIGDSAKLHS